MSTWFAIVVLSCVCCASAATPKEQSPLALDKSLTVPTQTERDAIAADVNKMWEQYEELAERDATALRRVATENLIVAERGREVATRFSKHLFKRSDLGFEAAEQLRGSLAEPLMRFVKENVAPSSSCAGDENRNAECSASSGPSVPSLLRAAATWVAPTCPSTASNDFNSAMKKMVADWSSARNNSAVEDAVHSAVSGFINSRGDSEVNEKAAILVVDSGAGRLAMELAMLPGVDRVVASECNPALAAFQACVVGDGEKTSPPWWNQPLPLRSGDSANVLFGTATDQFTNFTLVQPSSNMRTRLVESYSVVRGDPLGFDGRSPRPRFTTVLTLSPVLDRDGAETLRRIDSLLEDGGVWVHVGPLVSDVPSNNAPRLSYWDSVTFFVHVLGYERVVKAHPVDGVMLMAFRKPSASP